VLSRNAISKKVFGEGIRAPTQGVKVTDTSGVGASI
jgi:hypothetical protein